MIKKEAIKILLDMNIPGKCEIIRIFETPCAGLEVDNGCGIDFELSRFVIFVDGLYACEGDAFREKLYNSDIYNKEGVMLFDMDGVGDGLIKELNVRDGYKTIWKKG